MKSNILFAYTFLVLSLFVLHSRSDKTSNKYARGTDTAFSTLQVEFPLLKYLYGLFGESHKVENAHFPEEKL